MRIDLVIPKHRVARFRVRDDGQQATAAHIIFHSVQGRVLVMRRSGDDYSGHWGLPGGGIEPGETSLKALLRELVEEVGVNLGSIPNAITRLQELTVSQGSQAYALGVTNEFVPVLNDEHDHYTWASPSDLPTPMHPNAEAAIRNYITNFRGFYHG